MNNNRLEQISAWWQVEILRNCNCSITFPHAYYIPSTKYLTLLFPKLGHEFLKISKISVHNLQRYSAFLNLGVGATQNEVTYLISFSLIVVT